jgi:hypothetical protein
MRKSLFLIFVVMVMMCGYASATTVNCSADTMVSNFRSGTFGSNESLRLDYANIARGFGLLQYNITESGYGEYITNATMYIYFDTWDTSGATVDNILNNSWDEYTVDWDSRPFDEDHVLEDLYPEVGSTGADQYIGFNVSSLVDSSGTYSFIISPAYGDWFTILSRESSYSSYIEYDSESLSTGTFYVNNTHPSASNSNAGTIDEPWETLQWAVDHVGTGGTLYVIGNYTETIVLSSQYRTNISIIGIADASITSASTKTIEIHGMDDLLISGMHIVNTVGTGIVVSSDAGNNISINGNIIDTVGSAIEIAEYSYANNLTIAGNEIQSIDKTIWADRNAGFLDLNIFNNNIRSNESTGIYLYQHSGNNSTIRGNVINAGRNGIFIGADAPANPTGIFNDNNIIAGNDITAGLFDSSSSAIYLQTTGLFNIYENFINYSTYTGIKVIVTSGVGNIVSGNVIDEDGYEHNAIEIKGNNTFYYNNHILGYDLNTVGGGAKSWSALYAAGDQQEHDIYVFNHSFANIYNQLIHTGPYQENVTVANIYCGNLTKGRVIYTQGSYAESPSTYGSLSTSKNLIYDNISAHIVSSTECPILCWSLGSPNENATYDGDLDNYTRDTLYYIDINITNKTTMWHISDSTKNSHHFSDIYAINTNNENTYWWAQNVTYFESVLHFGYYANIKVVDNEGNPIPGAALTFEANTTNPETSAILKPHNLDYITTIKTPDELDIAYTNENGLTDTRYENKSNVVALTSSMLYNNPSSTGSYYTDYVEWNVTATYNGTSNSTIITPDMLRYSPDSADIQSDLVTIVLGVDTTEYWTPTTGKHYIGVPETWTWNAITGQFDITFSGTYTEPQTENTGVEIRP